MRTVTVVGASLAGLSAARALREQSYDGRIVLVGTERHGPYDRPPLSKGFLAGTVTRRDIELTTCEDDDLDLDWRLGHSAVQLDGAAAEVLLDSGERIATDGVVLATGAQARRLPGEMPAGVHFLRTVDDAVALREDLQPGARLVVVGGGFIGAEVASTARSLGVEATVVESRVTPLSGPLGTQMGRVCAELHADHGVTLHTGVGVARLAGKHRVSAVHLADGREIPADVVVVGIGARPCVDWLAGSGLTLDNGVVTDEHCATALPGVVAVGDCARAYNTYARGHLRIEHWTNALQQPAVAVGTLLGRRVDPPPLTAVPYFWSDQYGARVQFAGHRFDGDQVDVIDGDTAARSFVAVYRRAGRPVAVLAMNQPRTFGRWRRELAADAATLTGSA